MEDVTTQVIVVYQLGDVEETELANALNLANYVQDTFRFHLEATPVPIGDGRRLENGGFDLNAAAGNHFAARRPAGLVVYFAKAPYSIPAQAKAKDWFYFTSAGDIKEQGFFVASSHLWHRLWPSSPLESYILCNLAQAVLLSRHAMVVHQDTRSCLGDYCFVERDFLKRFAKSGLCQQECQRAAQQALKKGSISLAEMVAVLRLFNRASGRKRCFVAMPFRQALDEVYVAIRRALGRSGWRVVRGDELRRPPIVVEAVVQAILISDLVVADLTWRNPNVFHEVGIAQASGRDVLLLTRHREVPFNVRADRFVRYSSSEAGLAKLRADLVRHAGSGRYTTGHQQHSRR